MSAVCRRAVTTSTCLPFHPERQLRRRRAPPRVRLPVTIRDATDTPRGTTCPFPGGLLYIASRSDGQGSGDSGPHHPAHAACGRSAAFRGWFRELGAGFDGQQLPAHGTQPALARWDDTVPRLRDGSELRPWQPYAPTLPDDPSAWDSHGNRDFTLLTDTSKRRVLVAVSRWHISLATMAPLATHPGRSAAR